jgi:hypothetical protein
MCNGFRAPCHEYMTPMLMESRLLVGRMSRIERPAVRPDAGREAFALDVLLIAIVTGDAQTLQRAGEECSRHDAARYDRRPWPV